MLLRTQLKITMSFSRPWKASTVLISMSDIWQLIERSHEPKAFFKALTWALYGVIIAILPIKGLNDLSEQQISFMHFTRDNVNFTSSGLQRDISCRVS